MIIYTIWTWVDGFVLGLAVGILIMAIQYRRFALDQKKRWETMSQLLPKAFGNKP